MLNRSTLCIVLFAALLFCALPGEQHAGYTERITAQAFDQKLRPVEGVEVYVDYRLNSVTTVARTKSKFTNQSGMVDVSFTDYEEIENDTSNSYTLYMKYGSQLYTYNLISNRDNKTRLVGEADIKSYIVQVKAYDQKGTALRAQLTINKMNKTADATGAAVFQLPPGNYTLKAEVAGAVANQNVFVDQDKAVDMEIGLYPLEVYVTDDQNRPLVSEVQVGGEKNVTDASGYVKFVNISEKDTEVVVQNNESVKKFDVDLSQQSRLDVIFDRTKPEIKELHVTPLPTGAATLSLYIDDPGSSASGIDTVVITYVVGGVENQVPAYSIGYNTYEVKIPIQQPKTLVNYVVKVTDKEGNGALETGSYVVGGETGSTETAPVAPVTPGQVQIWIFEGETETLVIGGIVAALVLFGIFYYLRSGRKEITFAPQEPKPPEEKKPE